MDINQAENTEHTNQASGQETGTFESSIRNMNVAVIERNGEYLAQPTEAGEHSFSQIDTKTRLFSLDDSQDQQQIQELASLTGGSIREARWNIELEGADQS